MATVAVLPDSAALAEAAAERITSLAEKAVEERGHAFIGLTGGRTPRALYSLLADATRPWRARIPWARLDVIWGDERTVPPTHPDSNFGMAYAALLRHVPVPASQIHRMPGERSDPAEAARAYEATLRHAFAAANRPPGICDVMLLGIGEDAHIASIFPGSALLDRATSPGALVAAVWAPHLQTWRITLTPDVITSAATITVIAEGQAKAAAIEAAIEMPDDVSRWPAQLLRRAGGRVTWMVDPGAAARLSHGARRG